MQLADPGQKGRGKYCFLSGTLTGNPVACAAGLATLEVLRQPGVYERIAQVRDANREVAGGDLFEGVAGDGTSPSQAAVRNEQQQRLAEALQRLPEKQRLVFQLRLFRGLPFEEVARQ